VKWAKDVGIFQHPEWYPDLTPDSPVEDFQAHLHSISHGNCPQPCNATSVSLPPATPACHTAVEGEACYGAVKWAADFGIFQHPEWYPDLTPDSLIEDFQAHLYSINHGNCPQPCNATSFPLPTAAPVCHTAVEGEDCYGAVTWAMDTGITSNPEWYPDLTSSSSFEDFQARLHSIRHGNCPLPCPSVPAAPSCFLQLSYVSLNCTRRCGFPGSRLETGRCLKSLSWSDGHHVKVHLQEGSATCADSATARVDYFVNNSDCSGTPHSSMVIPTAIGTQIIDSCRDIYGNLWTNYACRAQWDP